MMETEDELDLDKDCGKIFDLCLDRLMTTGSHNTQVPYRQGNLLEREKCILIKLIPDDLTDMFTVHDPCQS